MAAVTISALSLLGSNTLAQEAASPAKDLKNFACKDIMRLSGTDRDIALALVHGYMLGKKSTTQYVVEELGEITDNFIDYCLDHPADNALQAFEKVYK
jgi:hypothetical protein